MVLESLAMSLKGKSGLKFFLVAIIYYTFGLFLGLWKFNSHAGLFAIFMTVVAAVPSFMAEIRNEEEYDIKHDREDSILKSHSKVMRIFFMFFLGVMAASLLWALILSPENASAAFGPQIAAIEEKNPSLLGHATSAGEALLEIISANLEILVLCVFFSFLYGMGAIFVLTWNASVIGFAIAAVLQSALHKGVALATLEGLSRFLIHGIPEVFAFVVAGLAGGIISVAVVKHHLLSKKSHIIILDSAILFLLSIAVLVLAGMLEVFVTPTIYFFVQGL